MRCALEKTSCGRCWACQVVPSVDVHSRGRSNPRSPTATRPSGPEATLVTSAPLKTVGSGSRVQVAPSTDVHIATGTRVQCTPPSPSPVHCWTPAPADRQQSARRADHPSHLRVAASARRRGASAPRSHHPRTPRGSRGPVRAVHGADRHEGAAERDDYPHIAVRPWRRGAPHQASPGASGSGPVRRRAPMPQVPPTDRQSRAASPP